MLKEREKNWAPSSTKEGGERERTQLDRQVWNHTSAGAARGATGYRSTQERDGGGESLWEKITNGGDRRGLTEEHGCSVASRNLKPKISIENESN